MTWTQLAILNWPVGWLIGAFVYGVIHGDTSKNPHPDPEPLGIIIMLATGSVALLIAAAWLLLMGIFFAGTKVGPYISSKFGGRNEKT